jgi:hypothetical protein
MHESIDEWERYPELEPSLIQDTRGRLREISDLERRREVALGLKSAMEQEIILAIQESDDTQPPQQKIERTRDLRIDP